MSSTEPAIVFDQVDVVYGPQQGRARQLLERGVGREEMRAAGYVIGAERASLTIRQGEICVLMGLSGSGKSSLLRCVNRLVPITRGRLWVNDGEERVDLARCDPGKLRQLRMRHISMVFQHGALMPWRTVAQNAAFGLELRGMSRSEQERRVDAALELVGLTDWRTAYPHELSGGMQQRVGLARAYVTDASILLMDEPFSALDPLTRLHLQEDLLSLQRRVPRTILFVTHDVGEALKMGVNVAILDSGRVIQVGSPEEIAQRPANDYVRQFVAGLNPLTVLRAVSIMQPLGNRPGMPLIAGGKRIELDPQGRPHSSEAMRFVQGDVLLREVIAIGARSGLPLLVLDGEGRLQGTIDQADIVRALIEVGGASS